MYFYSTIDSISLLQQITPVLRYRRNTGTLLQMIEPQEEFEARLKTAGYSVTRSRKVVFAALQDKEPQTMREILQACEARVDRASVYRAISLFEELGIVKRLQIGWKYKLELSDAFHHHHHHLTCLRCGTVMPLAEDTTIEQRLKAIAAAHSFSLEEHQLEIQGICQRCQTKT